MLNKLPATRNGGDLRLPWWPEFFEPFRTVGAHMQDFFAPTAEAISSDDSYDIELELPGVDEKDIDISLDDNVLTIKGEKREETEKVGKTTYFSERSYGAFQRSFRLPINIDPEHIDANFAKGILHVRLPKLVRRGRQSKTH